ncbi:MAG: 1-acyl-sn-glycerol-3-phosphate acyltransferase [Gammaproteobacteria bacterium]|nr:1-acyl-sn-glycerol-3-phosphate acyltransferase [Gammaproteobacteria bacterium]MBL6998566.1 1-acyl-sn-glycerol-3-phosphate acyltransferase [Gammaproteobacteria bacterium]
MEHSISLPYWQFIVLLLLAIFLLLDRVLLPGMRWYLRRRVNRVIQEVNSRLDIEIRPFQLTRKQALIDQLLFDDKVIEAIKDYAREHNMPTEVAQAKALKYATEIAPSFNAYVYFRFGYWIAKKIGRLIYRIKVGFYDDQQLQSIDPKSSVVFVMNHRSNMDYVLVSFLAAEKTALSYAVGEWARIWPLQTLIKSMGAFFVRRNSRNTLYRRVLERYVNLATRAGVCQAVFLEGGLTRDGKMREPKLGFLDYMLRDYHVDIDRDIVFIPVGINYDRVIEDRSLIRRLDRDAEQRSLWFVLKTSLRFFFKILLLDRKTRWSRFGYASVNFGKPVSARHYCHEQRIDFSQLDQPNRFQCIKLLSDQLMHEIGRVLPVLPVALMSEIVLAEKDSGRSELELKAAAMKRIQQLKKLGAPIQISASACEQVLTGALDMLTGRGLIDFNDGLYRMTLESSTLLEYYANSIAHWQPIHPQSDSV